MEIVLVIMQWATLGMNAFFALGYVRRVADAQKNGEGTNSWDFTGIGFHTTLALMQASVIRPV